MAFTHITATRDYDFADGLAPTGTVTFTPSAWLVNDAVTVPPAPVVAALDAEGRIAIDLVVNTDPDTTPTGSYYTVREEIVGQPVRSYRIVVPSDVAGFTVDIGYLEPPVDLGPGPATGYGASGYGTSGYGA